MNHELRITLFIVLSIMLASLFIIHPVYAATPNPDFGPPAAGLNEIEQVVGNIISVIAGLGFVAMLVLLITAGFKFLTSGGEPKALQAARQAATWALLGVFFMVIAWLILQLIANFTGLPLTIFNIKSLCGVAGDPLKFCK